MKEGILSITTRVWKLLHKGKYSIHAVAQELKIHYNSATKALEFLKEIEVVKEQKGEREYRPERIFSIRSS